MNRFLATLLATALALLALLAAPRAPTEELPGDSVYRIPARLTDSTGREFHFAEAAGQVRLVSMFYANCGYVCPMLIEQVRRVESSLDDAERARLQTALRTVLHAADLDVRARPRKTDSAEVYVHDEFVGTVSVDEDEGQVLTMSILDIDLEGEE